MRKYSFIFLILLLTHFIEGVSSKIFARSISDKFILVIDPGHGGKDPGAIGHLTNEKTINLNIALKLGELIKENFPDVKIIFTRKKDIYIPLQERAEIANKANADLFISIHTNALSHHKIAYGAETFSLGMARAEENLDIAKRENSVILLEKDYKKTYSNFNPNSPESYIIFEFMQDKYMKQSVYLATYIQQEYKSSAHRIDKGVRQAGFLVLRNTTMPSILTEVGFITTQSEERFLNSSSGTSKLAFSIYKGFANYKKAYEKHSIPKIENVPHTTRSIQSKKASTLTKKISNDKEQKIYKIQMFASSKELKPTDKVFKNLNSISHYREKGLYKYTIGNTTNYSNIRELQKSVRKKFPKCFIITFLNNKRIH